jgi:long-chain acyl-CoA synthetase
MHAVEDCKEIISAILPMWHAFDLTLYLTYGMGKQALLVLVPKLEPSMILDAMESPATVCCAVPPIYERTTMAAKEQGVWRRSCTYGICGAMTLPDQVEQLWESVSGGLLLEGYGMTVTGTTAQTSAR